MRFPRGTALNLVCSSSHTDGWALGLRESDTSDGSPPWHGEAGLRRHFHSAQRGGCLWPSVCHRVPGSQGWRLDSDHTPFQVPGRGLQHPGMPSMYHPCHGGGLLRGYPAAPASLVHTVAGDDREVWARECLVLSIPPWMR